MLNGISTISDAKIRYVFHVRMIRNIMSISNDYENLKILKMCCLQLVPVFLHSSFGVRFDCVRLELLSVWQMSFMAIT